MHIKPGATLIRPTIHTHLWNNRVRSGSTICSDRTDLYSLHTSLDFSGKYWVQNPCQCFQCVSASQFQLSLVVTCSTVSGPKPLLSGILQTSGPAPSAVSIPCTKLRCFLNIFVNDFYYQRFNKLKAHFNKRRRRGFFKHGELDTLSSRPCSFKSIMLL